MGIIKFFKAIYKSVEQTIYDDGVEHAGYMAFMIILSLFPFLVFFLSVTSFFGASDLGQNLIGFLIDSSPENVVGSLKVRLEEIKRAPPTSLINLAIFGVIWTASSFVEASRTILNRIYKVTSPPPYIFRRIMSIVQFIFLCGIIAVVMVFFVFIPAMLERLHLHDYFDLSFALGFSRYIYIFLSLFLCLICFYRLIPNKKIKFRDILPGALLTTLTWIGSGYLLSKYIVYYHQLSLVYGSLGSVIITMLFFYIINFLFIVGAAFNYQLSRNKYKEE